MEQFSNKYYLQIQQTFGGRSCGQALPRLAGLDDETEITESDRIKAEYHAKLSANAGIFEAGYFDLNLYEYYDLEPTDTEHLIV